MSVCIIARDATSVLLESIRPMVELMFSQSARSEGDFGNVELSIADLILRMRPVIVSQALSMAISCCRHDYGCPDCGRSLTGWGTRDRSLMTSQGEGRIQVPRYRCEACQSEYSPIIESNALAGTRFTLGAIERIVSEAAEDAYATVSTSLPEIGIQVSAKEVDRQVAQVAAWHEEQEKPEIAAAFNPETDTEGLYGWNGWQGQDWAMISVDCGKVRSPERGEDGRLKWFDARCGLIRPLEDIPGLRGYRTGGVMETFDPLFETLFAVWQRRPACVRRAVFLADGGNGIWERARFYFPDAVHILDIYHAGEHVGSASDAAWGQGSERAVRFKHEARGMLMEPNGPRRLIRSFLGILRDGAADATALKREIAYLYAHRNKMRYAEWKQMGLPIGSGAMESMIKQVCVARLRQPGMKWTRHGANAMLRVKTACQSQTMSVVFQRRREAAKASVQRYFNSTTVSMAA